MANTLYYCYDAYCGWCYGFSPVIRQLATDRPDLTIEVLSGGMILPENPVPISAMAGYILKAYPTVEELTGIRFGEDFLWHIRNPDLSDWYPNSEKSAIALCVFKEIHPDKQVFFAADLQYALNYEGRDLTDDEAYRHLLDKYGIRHDLFYERLQEEAYLEQARYEFQLCKQLKVTGFPCLFLQESDTRFVMLARGYTDKETLYQRLENALSASAE